MSDIDRQPDDEPVYSTEGRGETFTEIVERRMSRRMFLKGVAASAVVVGAGLASTPPTSSAQDGKLALSFKPIGPGKGGDPLLAEGYSERVLISWGDPLFANAPALDVNNQTAASQERQFGYNCDYVGFLPVPFGSGHSDLGLLVVNHEYTNEELMFAGYDSKNPSKAQVDVALAAHGMAVVQVQQTGGKWIYNRDAGANRRITGTTPIAITGPAAGHEWMKTSADPDGKTVLGTLNNCAGGTSPWGTLVYG
jgi:secreted PhoX family phosphatase